MGKLLKTLIYDNQISLALLDTTDIVNKAIKYQGLTPLTAAALGRSITIGSYMASSLKSEKDTLIINVSGSGVGGRITVLGNGKLQMRAEIQNPKAMLPLKSNGKLDVAGCVGEGRITVVKNMGLKEPYSGSSKIISGEIAEDFTAYYAYSEQQPTAIALGVLVDKKVKCLGAGGLILQPLPNCSEEAICKAEELITHFTDISKSIYALGLDGIIDEYFSEYEFDEYNPIFKCLCSKRNTDKILKGLGEKELYDILREEGKIEIDCHFCGKKYIYFKEDVDKLLGK